MEEFIDENELIVVNASSLCEGTVMRYRKTINSEKKSVIDYFIVCQKFFKFVKQMVVDEERNYCLTKYATKSGKRSIKESDHNTLILEIETIEEETKKSAKRETIFNFKNKEQFKKFVQITSNHTGLDTCFDGTEDIEISSRRFLKILKNILHICFSKVRLKKPKQNMRIKKLMKRKEIVRKKLSEAKRTENKKDLANLEYELDTIAEEISEDVSELNQELWRVLSRDLIKMSR